jgi:hypothetical protein
MAALPLTSAATVFAAVMTALPLIAASTTF